MAHVHTPMCIHGFEMHRRVETVAVGGELDEMRRAEERGRTATRHLIGHL